MIFLFIGVAVLAIAVWLLGSPLVLEIDTRKPFARITWRSVGFADLHFCEEWWLSFRVVFFGKDVRLASLWSGKKKPGSKPRKKRTRGFRGRKMLLGFPALLRTFRVEEWKLAVDTGDYCINGQLYPLNYMPRLRGHVFINFSDENFLHLRVTNRPWKLLRAYLRNQFF